MRGEAGLISRYVHDKLLAKAPQAYRVLSVHRRACNLIAPQGDILGVVHPAVGAGPFHIVLARPLSFASLAPGMMVQADKQQLAWPGGAIGLRTASLWNPDLPRIEADSPLPPLLQQPTWLPPNPHPAAVQNRLEQASDRLRLALSTGDRASLQDGIERAAGLGAGLTPAGDDMLLGLLARCWLQPTILPRGWTASTIGQAVLEYACPRTTRLSAAWLQHAAAGRFAAPWHRLAAAWQHNEATALQNAITSILSTGATSGADAFRGFLSYDYANIRSPHSSG